MTANTRLHKATMSLVLLVLLSLKPSFAHAAGYSFSLFNLGDTLGALTDVSYLNRASFFSECGKLSSNLPRPRDKRDTAIIDQHLMIFFAIEPVLDSSTSQYFQNQVMPNYHEAKTVYARVLGRTKLSEIPKTPATRLLALNLLKLSLLSAKSDVGAKPAIHDREGMSQILIALGSSLATANPSDILAATDRNRAVIDEIVENPRTEGFGIAIQTLLEWLRQP